VYGIATHFFTPLILDPASHIPSAKISVSIKSNVFLGHVFLVLHSGTTLQPASLLVMSNFDIFDDETDLWSLCCCKEEYPLAHSFIKHN
jgi:hypothetical protein